jgi:FeS assembly SUF system regulator
MLRLSKMTDYALLVTDYLAKHPAGHSSMRDIAAGTHVPQATVRKVLKRLGDAGVVSAARGVRGGYRLSETASDISVARIIDAMEGPVAMTECNQPDSPCRMECHCQLRQNWIQINHWVNRFLGSITLSDLSAPMADETLNRRIDRAAEHSIAFHTPGK